MSDEDELVISLSRVPLGQKESAGSFVMLAIRFPEVYIPGPWSCAALELFPLHQRAVVDVNRCLFADAEHNGAYRDGKRKLGASARGTFVIRQSRTVWCGCDGWDWLG
jgi:hypothetical protein